MKFYGFKYGQKLREELRLLSHIPFQERCYQLIKVVSPSVQMTPIGYKKDQQGIDSILIDNKDATIIDSYQCKSINDIKVLPKHLPRILDSIETFRRSGLFSENYFIILNAIIIENERDIIVDHLEKLIQSGSCKTATLFDIESFLTHLFSRAKQIVLEHIQTWTSQQSITHTQRLNQKTYIQTAPFTLNGRTKLNKDPAAFLSKNVHRIVELSTNESIRFFIVGEFGFGKTSLMHQLAKTLQPTLISCLYIPVAQLQLNSLNFSKFFMEEVVQILMDDYDDFNKDQEEFFTLALKSILRSNKRIVLILDGIDEHPTCYREDGLKSLVGIFYELKATCIFTVRKEYVTERAGLFEEAIRKGPKSHFINLTEWHNSTILEYINYWYSNVRLTSQQKYNLREFRSLISSKKYDQYFGDIPKRPLFLSMIMEDILQNGIYKRNIVDIYNEYLYAKFLKDRETSASKPRNTRPLDTNHDYEFIYGQFNQLLIQIAGKMTTITENEIQLLPHIWSSEVRQIIKTNDIYSFSIEQIIMHTVLIPAKTRSRFANSGEILLHFAHQSFLEFFAAQYLTTKCSGEKIHVLLSSDNVSISIKTFLKHLV